MLNNSNPVIYNQMKRPFLLFLPFLLFIAGAFVACEEVEEAGKYDNWVPRNEAFIDSIKGKTGDNIVASLEDAEKMEIGTLYAISVPTSGTGVTGTLRPFSMCIARSWKQIAGHTWVVHGKGKRFLSWYFHYRRRVRWQF